MKKQLWGVSVGEWIYKTDLTLLQAAEVVNRLQGEIKGIAIIPTGRKQNVANASNQQHATKSKRIS